MDTRAEGGDGGASACFSPNRYVTEREPRERGCRRGGLKDDEIETGADNLTAGWCMSRERKRVGGKSRPPTRCLSGRERHNRASR